MLENGEVLQVEKMITEKQNSCPRGAENKNEIAHLRKAVERMEKVDDKIFAKLDNQDKNNNGRWFSFYMFMITQLVVFSAGLILILLKLKGG